MQILFDAWKYTDEYYHLIESGVKTKKDDFCCELPTHVKTMGRFYAPFYKTNKMKKQINALTEFQTAFQDNNDQIPNLATVQIANLRFKLMAEENEEYIDAVTAGDLVEIADALGDQLYVLLGTIHKHGMNNVIEEVFDRIHASNMSKLDENGKPIINGENGHDDKKPMGKILKSDLYKKVDLTDLFKQKWAN